MKLKKSKQIRFEAQVCYSIDVTLLSIVIIVKIFPPSKCVYILLVLSNLPSECVY